MITFLSGGTGTPKLIQGFRKNIPEEQISIIANSADNFWVYGLYVSPDIDTILYLFGNLLDTKKYWGVINETYNTLDFLNKYGINTWFRLGDKDLGMHIFRTNEMQKGIKQSVIIDNFREKLGIGAKIFPSSEKHIETRIITEDDRDIHFQEFWVKNKGEIEIKDIYVKDLEKAIVPNLALDELDSSEIIIIGPSNPITSIGPIVDIKPIRKTLEKNRSKCITISPIIGEAPVSGPTGKLMKTKGLEISPVGIARLYKDICSTIIIHESDVNYIEEIKEETGLDVLTQNILFRDVFISKKLSSIILNRR
jgi:LPPG:FO 2-phospho-L-lactate transferase